MSDTADTPLPDQAQRKRAATTFDVNVVVTAGAGTGKTTLLVDRLVHLIMREPDPVAITQLVALTFTNKAANEMRLRLRERLEGYLAARLDSEPADAGAANLHTELRSFIRLYRVSKAEIDRRAREALRQLERSYIATIHSFAALLLRLYPVEAGIDPQFKEDDGAAFKRHFEERWSVWLDRELGREGSRYESWKQALGKISLEVLREIAFSLCAETVPLKGLSEANEKKLKPLLRHWLAERKREAEELIKIYPEHHNQLDDFASHALAIIQAALQHGEVPRGELERERRWFAEKALRRAGRWSEEDYAKLQRLCRVARGLLRVDRQLTQTLWELLVPFAAQCRDSFIRNGFISFDGLLERARNLLRDHRPLREELKALFKAILIDEFQDTDPVQYEILLYLAEKPGQSASDWQSVELQPGKIFVVGDPKQSIYGFRRADIQGYLDVVQRIILAQGGIECPLTTNFRSHLKILDAVNGVFAPLIRPREGLQPDYVSIQPPKSDQSDFQPPDAHAFRKAVFLRIASEEELSASAARRLEAEHLARWLAEEVLGKARMRDRSGEWISVKPKHVALLFRKLTEVHLYLEPLRRHRIPYIVEGEKHFYATQEIIDGVNLLRAVSDPYDEAALVGLLRSPLGALSDREIYELKRQRLLNYRSAKFAELGQGTVPSSEGGPSPLTHLELVRHLYEALYRLHLETRRLSVSDAVHRIFETVPIRILAARSFGAEQGVANIEKIRQQAAVMGRAGAATLKEVVAQLERRVLEVEDESESALGEENVDAVKILSIHKAKGLEFPVVILPDARGATNPGRFETGVHYDWSSDLIGVRALDHCNLAATYLDEKKRLREEEEQKRLFYVAMTRAREHLTISCPPLKIDNGSFVEMLERSVGDLSSASARGAIFAGKGMIEIRTSSEASRAPKRYHQAERSPSAPADWTDYVRQWHKRGRQYEASRDTPLFISPTALKERDGEIMERFQPSLRRARETDPFLIGTLAHGFLETLDFSLGCEPLAAELSRYVEQKANLAAENRAAVLVELGELFSLFFASAIFAELSSAKILGREIPLLMPWDGQIMEGIIDVVYERNGSLYIGDYKTDRINKKDLKQIGRPYRRQAEIYSQAVCQTLKRPVAAFKLIFLRLGEAIEVDPQLPQGELFPAEP